MTISTRNWKHIRDTLGAFALPTIAAIGVNMVAGGAFATSYPTKAIKLVVPLTAGSPIDTIARLTAPGLSARLGQPVIIENRAGGGGTIGAKAVAAAEADGYTLMFAGTTIVIAPAVHRDIGYDTIKSFAPIGPAATYSWVMVVPSSLPVKSVREFVAYAKANPGKLNFGFGLGTGPHLLGEMFIAATGIDVARISYRGGASQAVPDMLGGRVHMNFGTTSNLLPLIHDGKVRALAVTSETRSPDLPDIPTMIESGLTQLPRGSWAGLVAPAGTPAAIVNKLSAELNAVMTTSEMKANMARVGFEPLTASPQDFSAMITSEIESWGAAARLAGIVPQ
jgi:tripartite-type tricarboxylate transporter receptor subunit TctC